MTIKRTYGVMAMMLVAAFSVHAQDTYMNERLANNSNDLIGTARYVGMGGAMGALGADISVMSWNPAGIGLYRKNDVSLTFGGQWNKQRIQEENRGTGTFDQMGFVYSWKTGSEDCPYFNFGFNYQKKANYNYNFYAEHDLNGLSQMDQIAEMANAGYDTDQNLTGMATYNNYLTPIYGNAENPEEITGYYNKYAGEYGHYTHHTSGSLQGFDLNFSTNIRNRGFLGLTIGMDNVRYRGWTLYYEENSCVEQGVEKLGDYSLYNDYKIDGYGINVKLGTIFRPIEDSPLRIGLVLETPTWYRMKSSTLFDLQDEVDMVRTEQVESFLEYTMRSPWKLRACLGSTVGSSFAWDVDYEYAFYKKMGMGYPDFNEWDQYGNSFSNTADRAMNQQTKNTLKGVHTLRAGMEYRFTSAWAARLGYNFVSPAFQDAVSFDQFDLNSAAMDYATSTSYMRTGATNILTLGLGYRYKAFYVDLAYKIRNLSADFYAFDTTFASNEPFISDFPEVAYSTLTPANVNLTRQSITCTLGFKF